MRAIEVPTYFRDFDDYWYPFLGGQGPALSYAMSLSEQRRVELLEHWNISGNATIIVPSDYLEVVAVRR